MDELHSGEDKDTIHTALLYGGVKLGYYYVNIYLGTPPQKQTVIVDTGSGTTTFPCNDCSDCGNHIDEKFSKDQSTSAEVVKCHEQVGNFNCQQCDDLQRCSFSISYAEQSSLKGYFIRDYILFGDGLYDIYRETQSSSLDSSELEQNNMIIQQEKFKTVFGCTTRETNLFRTQEADGIMGLSPKTNNQNLPNVVDDLFREKHQGEGLVFSLCYNKVEGGFMSIGGYDKFRHDPGALTHTIPYYPEGGLYRITINDVMIGDKSIGLSSYQYDSGHGSFVDSGTTLVYADMKIFSAFMGTFDAYCKENKYLCPNRQKLGEQDCYKYDTSYGTLEDFFLLFPIINFKLENDFNFDWRPQDYLYHETSMTKKENMYCFALNSYPNRFILGGVWMRSWDILFDRQKQELSFTRSNCSNERINLELDDYDITQNITPNVTKPDSSSQTSSVVSESSQSTVQNETKNDHQNTTQVNHTNTSIIHWEITKKMQKSLLLDQQYLIYILCGIIGTSILFVIIFFLIRIHRMQTNYYIDQEVKDLSANSEDLENSHMMTPPKNKEQELQEY